MAIASRPLASESELRLHTRFNVASAKATQPKKSDSEKSTSGYAAALAGDGPPEHRVGSQTPPYRALLFLD